jgi:hypothetical protein
MPGRETMKGQHQWSAEWDDSGSVSGASVKVCEDCGAELIATWMTADESKPTEERRMTNLVYVAPCERKAKGANEREMERRQTS